MSSSTSSSPVPKKKKDKGKRKSLAQDPGKNEGVDLNWAFAPPPDCVLLEDEDTDAGEFDWDKINDDRDLEVCLIRVPDSVKPKYLDNVRLRMPVSSISPRSTLVGTLKRKYTTFDIWSVGEGDDHPVGGEEMKGLSCLLPRQKEKGKLYPAPKPFAHHLLISAQSVAPTPCEPSTNGTQAASTSTGPPYKNPPRQSYPKEVLKHQFMPYGSLVNVTSDEMDIDIHEEEMVMNADIESPKPQPAASPKAKKHKKTIEKIHLETPISPSIPTEVQSEGKKVKGKKRKGDSTNTAESPAPKKIKKTKT